MTPPSDAEGPDPPESPSGEAFLRELNDRLRPFDRDLEPRHPTGGPGIFIFGVPRSGTTLLYQLVAYCCDVGYITNVAARFWRAPLVGIRLSEAVDPGERPGFASRVGRTTGAGGVHEFGYFWSRLFGYEGRQVREPGAVEDRRWRRIEDEVGRLHREFGGPVVHKNLTYAFHLPGFHGILPDAVFLYLERDLVDTGLSILRTRERLYGDRSRWWSVRPLGGEIGARGLPPEREVAEQIVALRDRYRRGLEGVPEERVLRLRYRDLCASPARVLERILELTGRSGPEPSLTREPPDSFEAREHPADEAHRTMAAALDAAGAR